MGKASAPRTARPKIRAGALDEHGDPPGLRPPVPGDVPLIGPCDVAALLGVPVSWVYAHAEAGKLPGYRVGKYLKFRPSEITAWLEAHRLGGSQDGPANCPRQLPPGGSFSERCVSPREATRHRTALLESALHYAGRDWPVFPVHSVQDGHCSCARDCGTTGKHPRTAHGLQDATTDPDQIRAWSARWPDANVAIRTGSESFWVLDVDPEKGGQDSLHALKIRHGGLPETVEACTGGGGRHLAFLPPPGLRIPNSASALGPGLDVRGDGGYIVVAPSRHRSGRLYEWEAAHHPDEVPLAAAPDWLLQLVLAPASGNGVGAAPPVDEIIRDGTRNATLTSLAGTMRRRGMSPDEILIALQAVNVRRCRPALEDDELRGIAHSVGRYAPAEAPPRETGPEDDGLGLVGLGVLLDEPDETHAWVVEGRLPAGGLGLLGKPKAGKSTAARCLARAVARGEPWLGFRTTRGPVIYLALEEKRAEVRAHFRGMGATAEDSIFVLCAAAPADALARLRVEAARVRPVLIIIDPLFRFVRVEDGNDYATMTAALEPLMTLARETGAHVLLVHHLGKGERLGADAILGSTAIFGAVDSACLLRRGEKYRTIESVQRYGEDLEEITLTLDPVTRIVTAGGTRAAAEEADASRQILDLLAAAASPLTEAEIDSVIEGCRRQVWKRALRALVAQGTRTTRTGRGGKADPFSYSGSPLYPGTREPERLFPDLSTEPV